MPGIFANTPVDRSENMRAIRSKGNRSTERRLRAEIVRRAIDGWCMHPEHVKGLPDFFLPYERVAVFVDGCFWHGCPRCGHIPKTHAEYWQKKIDRNRERDRAVTAALKNEGFKVVRIWECDIRANVGICVDQILRQIRRGRMT